jgi:Na+/H+-translocating membrane pyrophosphatase
MVASIIGTFFVGWQGRHQHHGRPLQGLFRVARSSAAWASGFVTHFVMGFGSRRPSTACDHTLDLFFCGLIGLA